MAKGPRVNEEIQAREVLVIGEDGERLGVMSVSQALGLARERDTDLVEVASTAVPVVCRLLDFGKHKYEQAKKRREARRSQHEVSMREVRIRPKVAEHDFQFKVRLIRKLLDEGDRVKISVLFRGREMAHLELGQGLMNRVLKEIEDVSSLQRPLAMEGRNLNVIVSPSPQAKAAKAAKVSHA